MSTAMERYGKNVQTSSQENDSKNEFISHYSSLFNENLQLQMNVLMLEAKLEVLQRSVSTLVEQTRSLRDSNATFQLKVKELLHQQETPPIIEQFVTLNWPRKESNEESEEVTQVSGIIALKATLKKVIKEKADQMVEFEEQLYIQQEEIDDLKKQLRGNKHGNLDFENSANSSSSYLLDLTKKCNNQRNERENEFDDGTNYQHVGSKRSRSSDWGSTTDDMQGNIKIFEKRCALQSILRSKLEGFRNVKHKDGND